MEPFVIQCTTCRARLKVSDPALVGDIVGCPKCESFVQVTPPPGWQPPAPSTVPAAVVPAASLADSVSGSILLRAAQKPVATPATQPAARVAATVAPLAPPPLPAAALPATALPASGKAASVATRAAAGTSSLIVPEPATEPGALARLLAAARQHYWISVGSLTSLAAVVTIAWLAFGSKTQMTPATDLPATEVALGSDREQGAKDSRVDSVTDESRSRNANGAAGAHSIEQPQKANAGARQDPSNESADASQTAVTGPEPRPAADVQAEAASSTTSPITAFKADPLDSLARALATEPEPLSSTNPGAAPTAMPGGSTSGATASTDDIGSAAAGGTDDAATEELDGVKQARLVAHLQDKLPPIEFRDVPLGQFLAFLSEFSTVPIVIDSESLLQTGKVTKTKITVKLAGGTVEAALRAALAKTGLLFHVEPKRVVITAGAAKP